MGHFLIAPECAKCAGQSYMGSRRKLDKNWINGTCRPRWVKGRQRGKGIATGSTGSTGSEIGRKPWGRKQVRMKMETESRIDDLVQSIGELANVTQQLARDAVRQYSAEVGAILKARSHDSRRIEHCLDGMLDFCFDDGMLALYKKLCRHYFDIDATSAVFYVNAYREMWDEKTNVTKDEIND
jgi:hypothetical protein